LIVLCALGISLAGCRQSANPAETPIPAEPTSLPSTATLTVPPTPTIDWFPATNTPTLLPTLPPQPAQDQRPDIGDLLYQDDFSDPDNWVEFQIVNSSVSLLNQDLTMVIDQTAGTVYAFRAAPLLDDFYVEVTASPSYCQGEDEYGLMLRVTGTRRDHYRFAITCDGRAGVFRVVNDGRIQIVDWTRHPLIPTSFPLNSRLGVWVQGREMRFFINDAYLFSVVDSVIARGTVGMFAQASARDSISVSFSELEVYSLEGLEE
jgi:regulation of enolase protein 1 (concanavalin A-like superfamily)